MNEISFMAMLDTKPTASLPKQSGQGGGFEDVFGAVQENRITEQRREARETRDSRDDSRTERNEPAERPERPERTERKETSSADDNKKAEKTASEDGPTPDEVVAKLAKEIRKMEEATGEAPTKDEILSMLQSILAEAGLAKDQMQKMLGLFENATTPEGVAEFSDELMKMLEGEEKTSDLTEEVIAKFKEEVKNLRETHGKNAGSSSQNSENNLWEKLSAFKHSFSSQKEDATGTDVTRQLLDRLMAGNMTAEKSSESFLNARMNVQTTGKMPEVRVMEPSDLIKVAKLMETPGVNGTKTLEIQLNPQHLGKVNIELTDTAGKLTARVLVEQDAVKHMFVSQADQIRGQLAEKGIVIDNMEFAFFDSSEKDKQQGEFAKQTGKKKSGGGFFGADESEDTPETEKSGIYA